MERDYSAKELKERAEGCPAEAHSWQDCPLLNIDKSKDWDRERDMYNEARSFDLSREGALIF